VKDYRFRASRPASGPPQRERQRERRRGRRGGGASGPAGRLEDVKKVLTDRSQPSPGQPGPPATDVRHPPPCDPRQWACFGSSGPRPAQPRRPRERRRPTGGSRLGAAILWQLRLDAVRYGDRTRPRSSDLRQCPRAAVLFVWALSSGRSAPEFKLTWISAQSVTRQRRERRASLMGNGLR
jgi:hypothetical protein